MLSVQSVSLGAETLNFCSATPALLPKVTGPELSPMSVQGGESAGSKLQRQGQYRDE